MTTVIVVALALVGLASTVHAGTDGPVWNACRGVVIATHALLIVSWLTWVPRLFP